MTQNRIFGNGGTFCPSLPFWTILPKLSAYNWHYNNIWPSKPGYRHLISGYTCNIGQTMIPNIIFGNGGIFYPGLPFSVPPFRLFAKIFIFVFVPRNLIMSGVRPDSILSLFWKSSHRLKTISSSGALSKTFILDIISGGFFCTLSGNLERIVSIVSTKYLVKWSQSDFTDVNSGRAGGGTRCYLRVAFSFILSPAVTAASRFSRLTAKHHRLIKINDYFQFFKCFYKN